MRTSCDVSWTHREYAEMSRGTAPASDRVTSMLMNIPNTELLAESFTLFYFGCFYNLRRRGRGSAPTRAHHQQWNVQGLKKSPRTAETGGKNPPSDHSSLLLKGGAQHFQPSDNTKRQQKNKDSDRPTQTQKRSEKSLQTTPSQIFFRDSNLSLTLLLFLYFLSPHPSPFLSQPVHGVTQGPLWQQQPSYQASRITSRNTSRATWQLKATLASS